MPTRDTIDVLRKLLPFWWYCIEMASGISVPFTSRWYSQARAREKVGIQGNFLVIMCSSAQTYFVSFHFFAVVRSSMENGLIESNQLHAYIIRCMNAIYGGGQAQFCGRPQTYGMTALCSAWWMLVFPRGSVSRNLVSPRLRMIAGVRQNQYINFVSFSKQTSTKIALSQGKKVDDGVARCNMKQITFISASAYATELVYFFAFYKVCLIY